MFRPCIDIKGNKVVQLEQGERLALTDDRAPIEIAQIYQRDRLFGGHVIDLDGGASKNVILPALAYGRLQVGGGLSLENGQDYLDAGATHLIFSSKVFKSHGVDWEYLEQLKKTFGKSKIVLAPDVKSDRHIYVDRWKTDTGLELNGEFISKISEYCDELLIHSIEVEGMEEGIDWDLVDLLSKHLILPVTYAGGCTSCDTVEKVHQMGLDVTVGKAYFTGRIRHEDLVALNQRLEQQK